MMDKGSPLNSTISSIYNFTYYSAEYVTLRGRKCAELDSLSTIIHIESCCLLEKRNPTTKSGLISSYFHVGIVIF